MPIASTCREAEFPIRAVHTPALDGVRAVSAVVVFLSHIIQVIWLPLVGLGSLVHVVNSYLSETAVILFFVLSGYLISLSIHRNVERRGAFDALEYLRSRLLRIYPPLVGAVLVSAAVWVTLNVFDLPGAKSPLRAASDLFAAREVVSLTSTDVYRALTMRGGMLDINGPLWSLYIEVRLYVAAGAAAIAFKYLSARTWKLPFAVLSFAFVSVLVGYNQPEFLIYAAWWLLGALFFFWRRFGYNSFALAGGLILSAVIVAVSRTPIVLELARVVLVVCLSFLMFTCWQGAPKLLVRIGGFSYTLYLFHFPLLLAAYSVFLYVGDTPSAASRSVLTVLSLILVLSFSAAAGAVLENPRWLVHRFKIRSVPQRRAGQ